MNGRHFSRGERLPVEEAHCCKVQVTLTLAQFRILDEATHRKGYGARARLIRSGIRQALVDEGVDVTGWSKDDERNHDNDND